MTRPNTNADVWGSVSVTSECWTWVGHKHRQGYGLIKIKGVRHLAHRLMYTMFYGEVPAGMHVLHRCDNPACVNPEHLFIGSHRDNMRDMSAKGRASTYNRRLTNEQVSEIRVKYSSGSYTTRGLGREYNIDGSAITRIVNFKTYKHKTKEKK